MNALSYSDAIIDTETDPVQEKEAPVFCLIAWEEHQGLPEENTNSHLPM